MRIKPTPIFIFVLLSGADILTVCTGAYRETIENDTGWIQSPNLGNEYGKKADHLWRFNMREGKVLKLQLTCLKISYYDEFGDIQCGDAYRVLVNNGAVDCTKRILQGGGEVPIYYNFYSTPSCSQMDCNYDCSRINRGFVEVRYQGSEGKPYGQMQPSAMAGFMMKYKYLDCSSDETNSNQPSTTTTTLRTTTSTNTTTKNAPTRTSIITTTLAPPTTPTTTTTTTTTTSSRALKSTSTTTSTTATPPSETTTWRQSEESSANDQNVEIIYGSVGGGVSFVILLLIVVFCIVRHKKRKLANLKIGRQNDDERVPETVTYTNIISHTSQTVYDEITVPSAGRSASGSGGMSSSVTVQQDAPALYETPGYQTVTFSSFPSVTVQDAPALYEAPGYQTETFSSL